jgi:hypothetical protein
MKRFAFAALAALFVSILGCAPDAAIKRGEVIDAGPTTSKQDVKPDQPEVTEPKSYKESPVKQAQ